MNVYELETMMFYDPDTAEAAVQRLRELGFATDDIGVMLDEQTRKNMEGAIAKEAGTEGLAAGATVGGILGAIVAGLTASGSIAAIVGTGGAAAPLVAGPLAAALAGLGVGGAGGGVLGALVGIGIGENRAKNYEKGLQEGGILVAVRPRTEEDRAQIRSAFSRETSTGEIEPSREMTTDRSMQ